MIKSICAITALSISFSAAAELIPSPDLKGAPTNDPFIGYQWSLYNNRQIFVGKKSDVLPFNVPINPSLNIGWRNFDSEMKREPIIAVIDGGIAKDHPELENALIQAQSFISKIPTDDPLADDYIGHGTHIVGIIAARMNNGVGISGLTNRVQILPLKIYDDEEGEGRSDAERRIALIRRKPFKDRMIGALTAAIERKVDVINLSLGWPRVANHPEIEALFRKAMDLGILVVVSAGNDDHEAQIYPCAYRGVICVGSVSVEGKRSAFSNYGGHVDMLAPGQAIVSLWPEELDSEDLGPKGYEIGSGSSQAAAFVTAAAAILRGMYPDEPSAQTRIRILKSAKILSTEEAENPSVLFGVLNMTAAVALKNLEFTAPVFKGTELTLVDEKTLAFEIPLVIETTAPRSPTVQVRSLSAGVTLEQAKSVSGSGVDLKFTIAGKIISLNVNHRIEYEVTVAGQKFKHKILLARDVNKLNPTIVQAAGLDLTAPGNPRISMVHPIMNPGGSRHAGFYQAIQADDGRLILKVWRYESGQWISRETKLSSVSRAYPEFALVAHDWSGDGEEDYFFAGINLDDEIYPQPEYITDTKAQPPPLDLDRVNEVRYFFLNRDLKLEKNLPLEVLAGGHVFYPQAKEVMVGRLGLNGRKTPVFWAKAKVPKQDLIREDGKSNKQMLMFLEPVSDNGVNYVRTRALTSAKLDKYLRSALKIRPEISIELLGVKTQSQEDLARGEIGLLLFIGQFTKGKTYELKIKDLLNPLQLENLREISDGTIDIKLSSIEEAWDVSTPQMERATSVSTLYSQVSARSLVLSKLGLQQQIFSLPLDVIAEKFLSVMKVYTKGPDQVGILETTEGLRTQGQWNGKPVNSLVPVYRTSFLPGVVFSQLPLPAVVGKQRRPAMMMDNSHFFSRSLSVYSVNEEGMLTSPVRNSYYIPTGCSVSREIVWNNSGFNSAVFMCKRNAEAPTELLLLEME